MTTRRPETTCGFRQKVAAKPHRCLDCAREIERGALYVQDDYYAPFGNGRRYCLACGEKKQEAEAEWLIAHDRHTRKCTDPERNDP